MRFEICFNTPEGFTAHTRRDFIDEFQSNLKRNTLNILQAALSMGKQSQDEPLPVPEGQSRTQFMQDIQADDFKIINCSYPFSSLEEITLQLKVNLPQEVKNAFHKQLDDDQNATADHWVVKSLNFLGRKMLKDEYDKIDKEVSADLRNKKLSEWQEQWDQNIFSSFAGIVGPMLQEKFGQVRASFFIEGRKFSFPLDEILQATNPHAQQQSPKPRPHM